MIFSIKNKKNPRYFFKYIFCILLCTFAFSKGFSQKIKIELGKSEIALNEVFTISIVVEEETKIDHSVFPDIETFSKRGSSSTSTRQTIQGKIYSSQTLTQNYYASKEGVFRLNTFEMTINGETIKVEGINIKVSPPDSKISNNHLLSFEDFFGSDENPTEFIDVEEDAFLGLSTDKNEVYVGEGLNVTLAMYMAADGKGLLDFPEDLGSQLSGILKKLKPSNCWEEDFDIRELQKNEVRINDKLYFQFKIYEATYYPLNSKPILLPEVGLKMIKYKIAKNGTTSSLITTGVPESKIFNTNPKKIIVKDLPEHPLKDKVAVGIFRLDESVTQLKLQTGENFSYRFHIIGEGNVSELAEPDIIETTDFDIYPMDMKQLTNRTNGKVTGTKMFSYNMIPKEAGNFPLKDYFIWVYFNPEKEEYDTLRSSLVLEISGASMKNAEISTNGFSGYYNLINSETNAPINQQFNLIFRWLANGIVLCMFLITMILMLKKGQRKK